MSAVLPGPAPSSGTAPTAAAPSKHVSPNQRAWARFRRNRLGYLSLWIFAVMLGLPQKATALDIITLKSALVSKAFITNCVAPDWFV